MVSEVDWVSLSSRRLLEYVGISHWFQISDAKNEGFMASNLWLQVSSDLPHSTQTHAFSQLFLHWIWIVEDKPRAEVTSLPLDFAIAARYQGHSSADVEGGMSLAAPPGLGPHRMQ